VGRKVAKNWNIAGMPQLGHCDLNHSLQSSSERSLARHQATAIFRPTQAERTLTASGRNARPNPSAVTVSLAFSSIQTSPPRHACVLAGNSRGLLGTALTGHAVGARVRYHLPLPYPSASRRRGVPQGPMTDQPRRNDMAQQPSVAGEPGPPPPRPNRIGRLLDRYDAIGAAIVLFLAALWVLHFLLPAPPPTNVP
jgi:hypothetical protein